jgi:hypothetical protein
MIIQCCLKLYRNTFICEVTSVRPQDGSSVLVQFIESGIDFEITYMLRISGLQIDVAGNSTHSPEILVFEIGT